MLTKAEFERLNQEYTSKTRISAKQLMAFIEENLVQGSSNEEAYGNMRNALKSGITIIDPKQDVIVNETRKSEIKRGVKVRTEGESSKADDHRKTR